MAQNVWGSRGSIKLARLEDEKGFAPEASFALRTAVCPRSRYRGAFKSSNMSETRLLILAAQAHVFSFVSLISCLGCDTLAHDSGSLMVMISV